MVPLSHPFIILFAHPINTQLTAKLKLERTSATIPPNDAVAATYHSLNGLIISANPASFLLPFCQVTGQLMAEKLRYLLSFKPGAVTCDRTTEKKKVCQQ